MTIQLRRLASALAGAAIITLAGCGGGGGGGGGAAAPGVDVAVVDGAIKNAVVCLDKNLNGACDADEPQGRTNAAGKLRLAVSTADAATYPVLAMIGTDAEDADDPGVPVPTAYTMTSPAGKPNVINPLTTLINQTMQNGATLAEAEASVQEMTNIRVSLFEDYSGKAAPTDGSSNPAQVARMVVVATQAQIKASASQLGTTNPLDNAKISQADLNKAVSQKLLEMLPAIVALVTDPTYNGDIKSVETAVKTALAPSGSLVSQLLTPEAVQTSVAVNNQNTATAAAPLAAYVPLAGASLDSLFFTDQTNWNLRMYTGSLAQATPDANNMTRFVERRARSTAGQQARWSYGNNPQDNGNLHWNGSAWTACAPNFENQSSLRDAKGNNTYNYCDNFSTGKGSRATFPVDGKKMIDVYNQIIASGYTNFTITNAATALGATPFPPGSNLFYQQGQDLTKAFAYGAGSGSLVFNYSAEITNGGLASSQGAGVGCNKSVEFNAPASIATASLEAMVAAMRGTPCKFGQNKIVVGANTFFGDTLDEIWGATTLSIGTVSATGTTTLDPLRDAATATAYHTSNKLVRLAFTAGAPNEVTYYSCKERQINGFIRTCTPFAAKGSYAITGLADGSRVMTFSNEPSLASALGYTRVFIERSGKVVYGYRDKTPVYNRARLNLTATNALLTQLSGSPVNVDPETPLTLATGSYAGTWDVREPAFPFAFNVGTRVVVNNNGTVACFDNANAANLLTCTLNISDPATGAFTGTTSSGATLTGVLNFMAGTATGTFSNPGQSITNAPFVARRR